MSKFTNKELEAVIKKSMNLETDSQLNEAYVAQAKQFRLPTEFLSEASKKAHLELYDKYVKDFNRISAELDTADREDANSNHSNYRSL